jgi:hypothetical protein
LLPALQAGWIEAILDAPIPEETEATCDRCAMLPPADGGPMPGGVYFGAAKCCTYWPQLHGFLAGRLLRDPCPDLDRARTEVERTIDSRCGVTPLGLLGPAWFWLLYSGGSGVFGRAERLRCPFFDASTGGCGSWAHREGTCATWFCKLRRGAVGLAFWEAMGLLLRHVERAVAIHCATELDLGGEALEASLAESRARTADARDADGGMDPALFARMWGRHAGREREWYRACADIVDGLAPAQVMAIAGAEGRALATVVRRRFAALRDEGPPPTPLRAGRIDVVSVGDGVARLTAYLSRDPLEVPLGLLPALARFDGRPTAAVVREIRDRDGLEVSPQLVRLLADFEVLVPAEPSTPARGP